MFGSLVQVPRLGKGPSCMCPGLSFPPNTKLKASRARDTHSLRGHRSQGTWEFSAAREHTVHDGFHAGQRLRERAQDWTAPLCTCRRPFLPRAEMAPAASDGHREAQPNAKPHRKSLRDPGPCAGGSYMCLSPRLLRRPLPTQSCFCSQLSVTGGPEGHSRRLTRLEQVSSQVLT